MSSAFLYFKALADETRLRLLHVLWHYELSVNELVNILEMGQSRVSRHLKILTEAGLLQWRRDGLWVFYSAPAAGDGRRFIASVMPFMEVDVHMQKDVRLASHCIEERVLKTRQFFNAVAEDWDALNKEILGNFDLAAAVCEAVPASCALAVDLGCGTGSVLEKILPLTQGVVGVDGSPRMLEMARRRFAPEYVADTGTETAHDGLTARVSLRIGELDHLPLRDNEADFASINLVLHHLTKPVDTLKEVARILRPGGRLLLADFEKHNNEKMRAQYGDRWLGFTEEMLRSFIDDAALRHVEMRRQRVEQGLSLLLFIAEK